MTLDIGRTTGPATATPSASSLALSPGRVSAAASQPQAVTAKHHFGVRELLSDLNPLQYIPVIGTLFRAATGEVVPEPVRDAGSLAFSTLIGGPAGAAVDLGELAAEKLTGIDPEKIGDRLLADIGIGKTLAVAPQAEQLAKAAQPDANADAPAAWSQAQLAAYGVTTSASGEAEQGGLIGSDVLNNLELDQIRAQHAIAQYNTNPFYD